MNFTTRGLRTAALSLAALVGPLSVASSAQQVDVAILASANAVPTNCRFTDVQDFLMASGRFSSVDFVDCILQTPTAADLVAYEAVLTWANNEFHDATALGNLLADYVDSGGGVVVAAFGNTTGDPDRRLGGRWISGGYEVFQATAGFLSTPATLGAILDPSSPVVSGVQSLSATRAFRPVPFTSLVQGTVVAEWNDGTILAAVGDLPNRVDLGLHPPSSDCISGYWSKNTDGDLLIANALEHVAGGGPTTLGTNYCAANPNSTGQPALMSGVGSNTAVDNDVTIMAEGLPANSFAMFLTSQMQGFAQNAGMSAGNLCLDGSIGRYVGPGQIQQAGANGRIELALDLTLHPTPNGLLQVTAGQVWNFQAWYRDSTPGGPPTSNFTDGYRVAFF